MNDVFAVAAEMGKSLSAMWPTKGRNLEALPEASLSVLSDFKPEREITLPKVTQSVIDQGTSLPRQRNSGQGLGQPPLTLYNDPDDRFFLELYLWSCVDMTIHDHQFTGAFVVLGGECRNEVFEFEPEGSVTDLIFGRMRMSKSEKLLAGDARPITNGQSFIHRNQHLGVPTLTLVIRTHWDGGRSFIYDEDGMAHDPSLVADRWKQLEFLEGLLRFDEEAARVYLLQLLERQESATLAHYAIRVYLQKTRKVDEVDYLVRKMKDKFGPEISRLQSMYAQQGMGHS